MNKVLIFTATYNEAENISALIKEIFKLCKYVDILVVDDNSPDGTYKILESIQKNNKNLIIKKRDKKLGLNTAHIMAYDFALKKNYEKLITLDADFSHNPKEIPKIIEYLQNYDFVIGSRYMRGGKNDQNFFRYLISFFGNKLIRFVLNIDHTEFTTSYRGFNLLKLKNFHLNKVNSQGYSFFMETVFLINKYKFKSYEFPIYFKDRHLGVSKISKIEIFRTIINLIRLYCTK